MSLVQAARAGDEVRPAVIGIDLYAQNGQLTGDINARGLFSERIVGTIQSGLPAVVEVFYLLVETSGNTVEKGVHSYSLKYDIWDDIYSVTGQDSTLFLPSFEAMRAAIEQMKDITLVPLERMHPGRSHYVQLSIAVSPLQGSDKGNMTGWISENVQSTRETSWHEQVLNVNDLITHFFSREKNPAKTTEWFRSPPFKPELLPSRDLGER